MCHGVSKSGSPTPNEITFSMVLATSKKRRIPDGSNFATLFDMGFLMV
jgi:hypothetical protein